MSRWKGMKNLTAFITGMVLCLINGVAMAQQNIMVGGDSIVAGQDRPSFRQPLLDALSARNCSVDMVGSQSQNSLTSSGKYFGAFTPGNGYDVDHQGWPGVAIQKFKNGGTTTGSVRIEPISTYVTRYQPNFIVLHLGTNDLNTAIRSGTDTAAEIKTWADTTTASLKSVINDVIRAHSNAADLKVLVANFIPYSPDSFNAVQTLAALRASAVYTQSIESMVVGLKNSNVLVVDVEKGFDIDNMTTDGVHPNAAGERHFANAILPVLLNAGLCQQKVGSNTPELTSPAPGAELTGSTVTFNWESNGAPIDDWYIRVGKSKGGTDYANNRFYLPSKISHRVSGLPTDGRDIHVRFSYKLLGGNWVDKDLIYTAYDKNGGGSDNSSDNDNDNTDNDNSNDSGADTGGNSGTPELTDPAPGTELTGSTVTFSWVANGAPIDDWYIRVGKSKGGTDYANNRFYVPSKTSHRVSGLPTDGREIYVRFSYKLLGGSWVDKDLTYTASRSGSGNDNDNDNSGDSSNGGNSGDDNDTPVVSNPPVSGNNPPALNLKKVKWLHTDVSSWPETAKMTSVNVTSTQVCMNYDKANAWPSKQLTGTALVGNPWIFIWNEKESVWYGATWEWLRPGQVCKAKKSVAGDHIKKSPYTAASGWTPTKGETVYFMVSGLARSGVRNVLQRTAPVKVIWP